MRVSVRQKQSGGHVHVFAGLHILWGESALAAHLFYCVELHSLWQVVGFFLHIQPGSDPNPGLRVQLGAERERLV